MSFVKTINVVVESISAPLAFCLLVISLKPYINCYKKKIDFLKNHITINKQSTYTTFSIIPRDIMQYSKMILNNFNIVYISVIVDFFCVYKKLDYLNINDWLTGM